MPNNRPNPLPVALTASQAAASPVVSGPEAAAMHDAGDPQPIASVDEIETAFLRQAPMLLRYLYARTGRQQDAEDLLGDVFVQAWRYRGRIAYPEHWFYTVARHAANRFLSRRGRETPVEDVEDSGVGSTAAVVGPAVEPTPRAFDPAAPEIVALLALSDTDREILVLHGLAERPMPEVALILQITEAAAWQRWQRARDRYAAHLMAVGVHPPDGWRKPRRAASSAAGSATDGAASSTAGITAAAAEEGARSTDPPQHPKDARHDV